MTDLEKINKIKEYRNQILSKVIELKKQREALPNENQEMLNNEIKEILYEKLDLELEETITVNLAELLNEIANITNKEYPVINISVKMPLMETKKYSEQNIIEKLSEYEKLETDLVIDLGKYCLPHGYSGYFVFTVNLYLLKRNDISKNDCCLKIHQLNNAEEEIGVPITINYDLDKILIELPLGNVVEYDVIENAIINCLKKQEMNNKPKQLAKSI